MHGVPLILIRVGLPHQHGHRWAPWCVFGVRRRVRGGKGLNRDEVLSGILWGIQGRWRSAVIAMLCVTVGGIVGVPPGRALCCSLRKGRDILRLLHFTSLQDRLPVLCPLLGIGDCLCYPPYACEVIRFSESRRGLKRSDQCLPVKKVPGGSPPETSPVELSHCQVVEFCFPAFFARFACIVLPGEWFLATGRLERPPLLQKGFPEDLSTHLLATEAAPCATPPPPTLRPAYQTAPVAYSTSTKNRSPCASRIPLFNLPAKSASAKAWVGPSAPVSTLASRALGHFSLHPWVHQERWRRLVGPTAQGPQSYQCPTP